MAWKENFILVFAGTYAAIWNSLGAFTFGALPATAAFALMFWAFSAGFDRAPFMVVVLFPTGLLLTTMLLNVLHRRILGFEESSESFLRLLPRRRDWKAFGALILLTIAPQLPEGLISNFSDTAQIILFAIFFIAWLIAIVSLMPRVALLFPAIATDEPKALKTGWQLSKGTVLYFWPVFVSIVAVSAILFGGASALAAMLAWLLPTPIGQVTQAIGFGFLLVLTYALVASLSAHLYAMKQAMKESPHETDVERIFE